MENKNLAKTYQSKTPREHILDAPDTYIGSVEEDQAEHWFRPVGEESKMQFSKYKWVPGLFKCFDEAIVNASDHGRRMAIKKGDNVMQVSLIDVQVDKETGIITITNDGNGIDVAQHPENKLWIPEMVFGHLRTSTNYDKTQKKLWGGKNGFGVKLIFIYSTWGKIETVDHTRGLKYIQEFKNNLSEICKPTVRKCAKGKPYTKVSFLPDYKRFNIEKLTDDMFQLLHKRTVDIAAITPKTIKVKFNGQVQPVRTFENYIDLYIGSKSEAKRVYEKPNERWEVAIALSPLHEFTQVSFVNGINTMKGGKHVDYIMNQVIKQIVAYIEKKKKVKVKPVTIKEQLMIFVNCLIENPSFDSQTKEYMTTPASRFGSKCELSNKFIEKIIKMGVMESAISLTELKDNKAAKKTDGKKTKSITGIPNFVDANHAGGKKSKDCILILCEGLSAKAGIVSGLSKEDRNTIGIFPLKGKLLNTKDIAQKRINDNAEITNIKKIMGLQAGKKYTNIEEVYSTLRYGKILFMTDQDLDGTHIKGLCVNLFQTQWNELIKINSFLGFMNTPILKITKGIKSKSFYNQQDYDKWKEANDTKGWKVKYYKGLGTSTAKEFKEYFQEKKVVTFEYGGDSCDNAIDKVFNKHRADDRKLWLQNFDKDKTLDFDNDTVSYSNFVDKEMIHFSKYDCERSIPNVVDGLKTSIRKILFGCFKRKLTSEIKVAQLAGYISEHSAYHHGEMSLKGAIIGMAQEFVGSNNIALLEPRGQFGSRLQGGNDAASDRYIFTQLNMLSSYIYSNDDSPILNYLDDDGTSVEPEYYLPIIPMVLVNGGKGIGTGFSYEGLPYHPMNVIKALKSKIEQPELAAPDAGLPYYEGFKGTIQDINHSKFLIKGTYEVISDDTVRITELPVGTWTDTYKVFLETLMSDKNKKGKKIKPIIKKINDMSTDALVDITVKFAKRNVHKYIKSQQEFNVNKLEKILKLTTTKSATNMHLFDPDQKIKKYASTGEIIDDYYPVRFKGYQLRKKYMTDKLKREVMLLSNKARFIEEQCQDIIDLRKKKKQMVIELLKTHEYDVIDDDEEYKYLRNMPIDSVIEENITELRNKRDEKKKELDILVNTTIKQMWMRDLKQLEDKFDSYVKQRENRLYGIVKTKKSSKKSK